MPSWHAKSSGWGYSKESQEAIDNATLIAAILQSYGWGLEAICAALGNMAHEGGYNPWQWQGDYTPTYAQYLDYVAQGTPAHAYGLCQWDPASKYINGGVDLPGYDPNFSDQPGSPQDGAAQTHFLARTIQSDWLGGNFNYYNPAFSALTPPVDISSFYYMTFADFLDDSTSYNYEDRVGAFELKFERPGAQDAADSYEARCDDCLYWLVYFGQHPIKKTNIWLYKYYLNHKRRCGR